MSYDLVTFGETMIRLSPPGHRRLEQATTFDVNVGGSELNTAVAAQRLGLNTAYIARLTKNPLGQIVENKAREHGVDTSQIVWTDEDRVGTYFVEFGASPRANTVLYDRRDSAIARLHPGEVDWNDIFRGGKIFHTSGITPALSPNAAEVTTEAVEIAKKVGLKVSIDLNYRARLWSQEEYVDRRLSHWYSPDSRDQINRGLDRVANWGPTRVVPGHDAAFRVVTERGRQMARIAEQGHTKEG